MRFRTTVTQNYTCSIFIKHIKVYAAKYLLILCGVIEDYRYSNIWLFPQMNLCQIFNEKCYSQGFWDEINAHILLLLYSYSYFSTLRYLNVHMGIEGGWEKGFPKGRPGKGDIWNLNLKNPIKIINNYEPWLWAEKCSQKYPHGHEGKWPRLYRLDLVDNYDRDHMGKKTT